jgi:hypothetical protein
MSAVSNIYEAYHTLIAAELPTYKRLSNPYNPLQNPSLYLTKGYGVTFGPAENTERIITCKVSILRNFEVILTRQIATTENNNSIKEDIEEALMEDLVLLIKATDGEPTLQETSIKTVYVADSGIEYLEADKFKYFLLRATFASEYLEDTTT